MVLGIHGQKISHSSNCLGGKIRANQMLLKNVFILKIEENHKIEAGQGESTKDWQVIL